MRAVLVLLSLAVTLALYEEPVGGCGGPPLDDFDRGGFVEAQPQLPRRKPTPPPTPPAETQAEEHERLERELYERESMSAMKGLGGDIDDDDEASWAKIESDKAFEQQVRRWLKQLAFAVLCGYVARKLVLHLLPATAKSGGAAKDAVPATPTKGGAKKADDAVEPTPIKGLSDDDDDDDDDDGVDDAHLKDVD